MTPQEINIIIIMVARRAPLANMAEAEAVAQLLQKLATHFAPSPEPASAASAGEQSEDAAS